MCVCVCVCVCVLCVCGSVCARACSLGWTMLGDACPVAGCNTPLVRSRQGEVWCARCGAAVVKEGDAMSVPSSPPSTTEVAQKARAAWAEAAARDDDEEEDAATASSPRARAGWAVEAAEADGEDVEVANTRKPRDAKARDAASAAIGQKLLSGWTLLDEACGRCTDYVPLMRDTNQREVLRGLRRLRGRRRRLACVDEAARTGASSLWKNRPRTRSRRRSPNTS